MRVYYAVHPLPMSGQPLSGVMNRASICHDSQYSNLRALYPSEPEASDAPIPGSLLRSGLQISRLDSLQGVTLGLNHAEGTQQCAEECADGEEVVGSKHGRRNQHRSDQRHGVVRKLVPHDPDQPFNPNKTRTVHTINEEKGGGVGKGGPISPSWS